MGKKGGGTSWLTAVKRAFRSPNKESEKKSSRQRRDEHVHDQEDDDEKKKEKRRWLFRRPANQETVTPRQTPTKERAAHHFTGSSGPLQADHASEEQKHAITMEVATAAVAEAAVASARATAEVTRLIRPPTFNAREIYAAIVIQTAFRGYLARRALRALKGLVKLQALVRGHNVRKQAKMTLRCMQALVRVQARVLDQRVKLSQEGSRRSTFSETNNVWDSRYLQGISDGRSMSREGSSIADDWDERAHTIEEVKAMLLHRKEAALKREKKLSQAFSQQMWRNGRSSSMGNEDELEERTKWLGRWMATKPWERPESNGRSSTDNRDHVKTIEIDTSKPYSYLAPPNPRRTSHQNQYLQHPHQRPASPSHGAHQNPSLHHSSVTPSPSKTRHIQVRSASPRWPREDSTYSTSQTPSLRSNYYYTANVHQPSRGGATSSSGTLPNYMAATESAKARARSQSAPRQRPSTPERDRTGSAKKKLSFPVPEPYGVGTGYNNGIYGQNLRSPSFKSVGGSYFVLEQQSNYSSCHTESLGGEISPSSTSDLRRWLR